MNTETIKKTIHDTLSKLHVSVDEVSVEKNGELVMFTVQSPEGHILIGKDNETMDALNYLIGLIVSKAAGQHVRVNIDVNGHKQNALNALMAEARKVADEVKKTKESIPLRPMTAYERLIIHNMFSDDIQIETTSAGEGEERHIVLAYSAI